MRRCIAVGLCGLAGLFMSVVPVSAAQNLNAGKTTNWNQRDTAIYVVSTLNLLHVKHGHALPSILAKRFNVAHYDVLADTAASDLYFVELKTADGTLFGVAAYQMGWARPMSLSASLDRLHVRHAPAPIDKAYATDPKQPIGSFTSTLPT